MAQRRPIVSVVRCDHNAINTPRWRLQSFVALALVAISQADCPFFSPQKVTKQASGVLHSCDSTELRTPIEMIALMLLHKLSMPDMHLSEVNMY